MDGTGPPVSIGWNMFEDAGPAGPVGPGSRGVSFGHKSLLASVAPGPATGSCVKPPEGNPIMILCDMVIQGLCYDAEDEG